MIDATRQERLIRRFRTRLALILGIKYALAFATAWAFVWGVGVLVLRAGFSTPREMLLWGLAILPLAIVPAVLRARRRMPSAATVRALLDEHNSCGGILMAGEEPGADRWQQRLPEPAVPGVRWRWQRAGTFAGAAIGFLLASFLIPDRYVAGTLDNQLEVGKEVGRLAEQVKVLKEEKLLEPQRAEEIQKKLEQLKAEARGTDPVKTLESLDRIANTASEKAKEATEKALNKTEEIARAETVADVLRKKKKDGEKDNLSDKARAEAMQELARLTREALKDNDKLLEGLDPELLKKLQENALDAESLDKLGDALKMSKEDLKRMLEKLANARLIDPDKLKECKKCGECDGEALAKFLKECEGKCSAKECIGMFSKFGRGGITRGPGAADLSMGEPSKDLQEKLKEETLQGDVKSLKETTLQGVSKALPKVENGGAGSGALEGAAAGGGSANTQIVLPRHRGAVQRYFDRPPPIPK